MLEILTPESERRRLAPNGFLIQTARYGVTESVLDSDIESNCPQIEGCYHLEVPEPVLMFCSEIRRMGGRVLLVGGCVRDMIISAEIEGDPVIPKDFDLEVYGIRPDDLLKIIGSNFDLNISRDLVGRAFQIINVYLPGLEEPLNISIPRKDNKVGPGNKNFETTACPTMTIREAAIRRDLRMNSCAYDPLTETLYDPFDGIGDIRRKLIEVTDPVTFQEDPLRVLRIMQFAGRFGFGVGEATKALCRQMVERGDINTLSIDRIAKEMKKFIIKSKMPSCGLRFALEVGLVEKYWPELHALVGVKQEPGWHPEGNVWTHTLQVMDAAVLVADSAGLKDSDREILLWASLTHDLGKPVTTTNDDGVIRSRGHEAAGVAPTLSLLERFANPGEPNTGVLVEVRRAVAALVCDHLRPKEMWLDVVKRGHRLGGRVRRLAWKLGLAGTNIYLLSLLAEADQRGRNGVENKPLAREEVEDLETWQSWLEDISQKQRVITAPPQRICSSSMVMNHDRDKKPGPWVGAVKECVYQDEIDGLVLDEETAADRAGYYYHALSGIVRSLSAGRNKEEHRIWEEIKKANDPRTHLQEVTSN